MSPSAQEDALSRRPAGPEQYGDGSLAVVPPVSRPGFWAYLAPKEPIPGRIAAALALVGLGAFIAIWALLTYGGRVSDYFLPSPTAVLAEWGRLIQGGAFFEDVWASTRRIFLGFAISAAIAVPLGILMGSFRFFQALLEPLIGAVRYMPASAFIPLLIIWLGIGDAQKVGVVFIGVFFPLTLLIADVSAGVPKELINIAYTLGASRWQVFWRVLLPASLPGVVDNLRITMGWAWTYLIVAELVGADSGIGHLILQSQRFLATDRIIASILTIGLLGVLTDTLFRVLYARLFPYVEKLQT
ncbi:MAG: ABC transporter permease [Thermomicrobiales bacterium]|nr:ABC transporter permease [Thermomicrobiales bacterium]